jgi:formiminotetrahydrofolate cyclodeaminase
MTSERAPWMREDRLETLLGELLDDLASEAVSPAASSIAGLIVAFAAALTAKSARRSGKAMESAAAMAAQADSLRRRALALASLNAEAYEQAMATLPSSASGEDSPPAGASKDRDLEIRDALTRTSEALTSLLDVACDVCLLAELVAKKGEPAVRADAAAAATLAEAGGCTAVQLIEINLLGGELDEAKQEAGDALATASEATGRAQAALFPASASRGHLPTWLAAGGLYSQP